jgi:hypothetical protein
MYPGRHAYQGQQHYPIIQAKGLDDEDTNITSKRHGDVRKGQKPDAYCLKLRSTILDGHGGGGSEVVWISDETKTCWKTWGIRGKMT